MYDVIVIGAGPAGLQAALTLGRMHRSTLVLDSGQHRNGTVAHMHNMIGFDGTDPAQLRAAAHAELTRYASVERAGGRVTAVSGSADAFTVSFADGCTEQARRIVLATGMIDDLPDVSGLGALWGRRAFACPFCDGHEFAGSRIGVIGATAMTAHLLGLLSPIVADIVVFPVGAPPTPDDVHAIEASGARIHPTLVDAVEETPGGVNVHAAGSVTEVAGLFVTGAVARQRAPFAEQLGLRMLPSGAIEIDEFGRTSVPGVSAAGDLAHRESLPGPMASVLLAAAAGQVAASMIVKDLADGTAP